MPADPWGAPESGQREHLPDRSWFHWSLLEPGHLYAAAVAVIALGLGALVWATAARAPSTCIDCQAPNQVGVGLTADGESMQIRLMTCEPAMVDRVVLYDQDGATRWEIAAREAHSETVFLTDQVFGAFDEIVPLGNLPVSADIEGIVEADRQYVFQFSILDLQPDLVFYRYRLWTRPDFEKAALEAACPTLDLSDNQARLLALGLLATLGLIAYVASGRLVVAQT